jgi:molybdate transport system ATP-binding protein
MGLEVRCRKVLNGFVLDAAWNMGDELAVLFGFSGAGKSLTLQMIAGLIDPDEGRIVCNGRVLCDRAKGVNLPPRCRGMGYVFQDLALFPHMTVLQNILAGATSLGKAEGEKRAIGMLQRFGLCGLEGRRPAEISGGQRQRVALARALIRRPAALLLDEPFSALDAPLRRELRDLLREVQEELAIPVVLVTHDREEALSLADRVIVYAGGRVLQAGTPEEILAGPATDDVTRLLLPDRPCARSQQVVTGMVFAA